MTDIEETDKPTKAMFEHCCNVFNRMQEESTKNYDGSTSDVPEVVYEGFTTKLFQGLELSPPYYSTVLKLLTKMGCIAQLRRGGGSSMSRWLLQTPPTEDAFKAADAMNTKPQGKVAALEQQVRDLNRRILRIEENLGIPAGV